MTKVKWKSYTPPLEQIKSDRRFEERFEIGKSKYPDYRDMTFKQMIEYSKQRPSINFSRDMPIELCDAIFDELDPDEEHLHIRNALTNKMNWRELVDYARREKSVKTLATRLPVKLWDALVEQVQINNEKDEFEQRARSYLTDLLLSADLFTVKKELRRFTQSA